MPFCFSCQKEMSPSDRVGRQETCIHCGADLHVCLNCEFHDLQSYNECREPSAERVLNKDRSNYCDYFLLKTQPNKASGANPIDEAKRKLEQLFKK